MTRALIAALAVCLCFAGAVDAFACEDLYARKSVIADTEELKCVALHEYSRCVADAALTASQVDADTMYADLAAAQERLSSFDCTPYAIVEPPRIQTRSNDLLFTTNSANDILFVRYRKDTASIAEMQDGLAELRTDVTSAIADAATTADRQVQDAATNLAAKIAGVQGELDIRFAVTSGSVSAAQVAAGNVITRVAADTIITSAIVASVSRQDAARNTSISDTSAQQLRDFTNQLQNLTRVQTEMGTDRNATLADSASHLNQTRIDYNTVEADTRNRVSSAISTYNTREPGVLQRLVVNVTNTPIEGTPCNSSQIGRFRVYELPPPMDVDPASAQDDLNGVRINMPSYSHGSGYSTSRNEIWTPQWSGTTIYRHSPTTFALLGTFTIPRDTIMQCAGDDEDFIYGAHWGQALVCKYGPFPGSTMTQRWCYNTGGAASGVTVDARFVYSARDGNGVILVIDRFTGALSRSLTMQSFPGGSNYGIASLGNRLWWLYNTIAVEYDITTGVRRRSFNLVDWPYAVYTTPDRFCFSPNSNQFACYRIRTASGLAYGLVCDGTKFVRV